MSNQIDPRLSGAGHYQPVPQRGQPYANTKPQPQHPHQHQHQHIPQAQALQPGFAPPRNDSLRADGYANVSTTPYYHGQYPTPNTSTPQQHSTGTGAPSTGSISNQASPEQNGSYQQSALAYAAIGQTSPDAQGYDDGDGLQGDDAKRPRACESCRALKVRCDQDPAHPEIPCKRCAKANRPCVITQPSRKRQKKADSRVAELEKKLDALTAALHHQHAQTAAQYGAQTVPGAPLADMMQAGEGSVSGQYSQAFDESPAEVTPGGPVMPSRKRQRMDLAQAFDGAVQPDLSRATSTSNDDPLRTFSEIQNSWAPTDAKRYLHHTSPEEFTARINSLINPEMASDVFGVYINKLAPHLPAVVFPPGTTAEQLFKDKPILYVSILSAASFGTLHPDITRALAREAVGAVADCVVRNGAKSLELIQAMQVMALWYKPPEKAEQTNFYQIIHMAAVMALDIGLGKRFNPAKSRRGFGGPNANFAPGPHKTLPQDSDTLEARRAWLGCYYLCASASMVLRRPNLVRWTNYMKECIEVLESHPDAYPSDKLFCQHVKIQHICEDIGLQFLMDDNTATISITDPKVSYALNVLENQLKTWKEQVPQECRGPGLQFFEHVCSLYLHEIALHFNHNIEDFRLPFTEESLKSVNNTADTLTTNQIAALEACLKAAHGILDTMLSYETETIKSLPMLLFFVRCVYAIVILIKMHVAVCTPNSELGKMMKPQDLKVDYYIDKLINLFSYVSKGGEEFRPHPKILRILTVLRDWFGKHKENVAAQQSGKVKVEDHERQRKDFNQTPLHLLSQAAVASTNPPPSQSQGQQSHQRSHSQGGPDWTFNTPTVMDYSQRPPPNHPDYRMPKWNQPSGPAPAGDPNAPENAYPQLDPQMGVPSMGMVDPTNQDYGWGSGFEQAMDIALGGVDGLQGSGLDNWFLGDGMAPFGFNGDMGGGYGGQW
ncbi:hypothetical protein LTR78_003480 [Recurvomyces mirabilis]|uniref:Zn(2)-C6 fungal-type domain-containing protein n=1 Tax=Recurvomyces mirabilis TaxID=574656 RepID=A0AAE0WSA3_9PEZI|nr:hypothetical protein LTR78_003480 [Recurvomyces mirabilis]KAK5154486.1 hypothetical protein LTS14_006622 [Recurvomyces mirabilis]